MKFHRLAQDKIRAGDKCVWLWAMCHWETDSRYAPWFLPFTGQYEVLMCPCLHVSGLYVCTHQTELFLQHQGKGNKTSKSEAVCKSSKIKWFWTHELEHRVNVTWSAEWSLLNRSQIMFSANLICCCKTVTWLDNLDRKRTRELPQWKRKLKEWKAEVDQVRDQ